jgi:hypothetical protein
MIMRVISKRNKTVDISISDDLSFWLKQSPEERISAVEILRLQYYGGSERLQRVSRIIKRT